MLTGGEYVENTSSPTSSAFKAIVTIAVIRSCSVGIRPLVGSTVTSPTLNTPNCILTPPPAGPPSGQLV